MSADRDAADARWESKRRAREAALRMLYQVDVGQTSVSEAARHHQDVGGGEALDLTEDAYDYAATLAAGVAEDRVALDGFIADATRNWRVERLAVIDRLVLRLAVHELLAHPTTPPRVVIDEAIELARRYSGEDAAKFVNGVLDGVFKRLREEGKVVD